MAHAIAIKVDEALLRDIHIHAAEKGLSTQQYITGLIERDLFPERFPTLNEVQTELLRSELEQIKKALEQVTALLEEPENGMVMGPLN